MGQLSHMIIKEEDDETPNEVLINNEEIQQQDNKGSLPHSSSNHVTVSLPMSNQSQPSTSQHSSQRCTKVKKEEKNSGEIKLEWDGDECDCEECRAEREIKIEFNQTNEIKNQSRVNLPSNANKDASFQNSVCKCVKKDEEKDGTIKQVKRCMKVEKDEEGGEIKIVCKCEECTLEQVIKIEFNRTNAIKNQTRVNLPGPSDASKGASSQCKRVKKEEEHDEEWDEDCDCDQCRRMRLKAIPLKLTNATENREDGGEVGRDDGHETEVDEEGDGNENDQQVGDDGDLSVDAEDGNELDEECEDGDDQEGSSDQISDDDDETEIDDEEYEMDVDGEESSESADDETEVDEQSEIEDQSPGIRRIQKPKRVKKKSFRCPWLNCNKAFPKRYKMEDHHRTHTGERPFKCPQNGCEMNFTSQSNMQIHFKRHAAGGEKRFKCPWKNCNKIYVDILSVRQHHKFHTPELLHKCKQCGKGFNARNTFRNHLKTHSGERPFKCPWESCNKDFANKSCMRLHHKLHTPELLHKCDQCGRLFQTLYSLKEHIRSHTAERSFKCPWEGCKKDFADKINMQRHYKYHKPELLHKCDQCDKGFTWKCNLEKHILIHDKSYKCSWKGCDTECKSGAGLKSHLKFHSK